MSTYGNWASLGTSEVMFKTFSLLGACKAALQAQGPHGREGKGGV